MLRLVVEVYLIVGVITAGIHWLLTLVMPKGWQGVSLWRIAWWTLLDVVAWPLALLWTVMGLVQGIRHGIHELD